MSSGSTISAEEREIVHEAIVRLRARVMAVVCGMLFGVGLFMATAILLLRGPDQKGNVGPTLSLLKQYLPGYSVTWGGAFLGLIYGLVVGAAVGWVISRIYNWMAFKKD